MSANSKVRFRRRDRDQKRLAVLTAAAELFLKHGYHRTKLDDVAESLNITKPTLYNYFRNKQEILYACHMHGHDITDKSITDIEESGKSGLERLKLLIKIHTIVMTQDFGKCLVLLDEHELSPSQRKAITARRRVVNERFESYLNQGISDESIEPVDVRLAAFSIAGSLNWTSHWFKQGKGMSSEELGNSLAEFLTRGLAKQNQEQAPSTA